MTGAIAVRPAAQVAGDARDEALRIARLQPGEAGRVSAPFLAIGWRKPASLYEDYLEEQAKGEREVLVAWVGESAVGHVSLVWRSDYRPFREALIPEIKDFAVAPSWRRRGFGSALMDAAEALAGQRSTMVGLGVGLYPAYGPAQRLYVLRGYAPDGQGLAWNGRATRPMQQVRVDDGLNLYLVKRLGCRPGP